MFLVEIYTNGKLLNVRNFQISETLQMQIEVQRRLHEQLEVKKKTINELCWKISIKSHKSQPPSNDK